MTAAPSSTYRIQLRPGFGFAELAEVADYLASLGVGAVYTSPLLAATPGSTHGYDVVDPRRASDQLGGESGRRDLLYRLREQGLDLVLDIVPNHMGIEQPRANPWWWDVLARGRESAWARFFDIDFDVGPILVPVLADDGDGGEQALASLAIRGAELTYHEHRFPIAEGTSGGTAAEVHSRQYYRLVSWRRAAELNYRRFFDISTLAAVRVEDAEVFAESHAEVLRWVSSGEVCGLRIDHPDGLTDPGGYLRRLREHAPDAWLVVEKVLAIGETLPASWPVDGTTGYDALREYCGVFVDPGGAGAITLLTVRLCGTQDLSTVQRCCKRVAASSALRAEVLRIARLLHDFPLSRAAAAVTELLASFRVYRSYLPSGRAELEYAAERARGAHPEHADVLAAIVSRMLAEPHGELANRVQQTSGMVMAKGVEDTTFYRYPRLVALNEVGGDPGSFGVPPEEFHTACAARESAWPATMTTLSTHDTKRSEDVRARIATLSEIPERFAELMAMLRAHVGIPEPTLELLAAQTVVGAWPIGADRLTEYLLKAAREAKLRTSWTARDEEFEQVVRDWAAAVTANSPAAARIAEFVDGIRAAGWSNSLGAKLLQLAGPGVPDVYQGTECWDDSLVDPDNRRPVDYGRRRELLARLDSGWLPDVDDSGAVKLLLVRSVLRLRRDDPARFTGYHPLCADGPAAVHAVAFSRGRACKVIALATRLPLGLERAGGWADTTLTLPFAAGWRDILTGNAHYGHYVRLTEALARYPVALLVETQ